MIRHLSRTAPRFAVVLSLAATLGIAACAPTNTNST